MTIISYLTQLLKHLVPGLLLLVVPLCLLYLFDRQLMRRFLISFGRMLLQMGLMALILWVLYSVDSPWLNLCWLLLMSVVSAWVVVSRARLVWSRMFLPVAGGTFLSVLAVTVYVLLAVVHQSSLLSSRWFVPVACVMLTHVLVTNIRSLSAFYEHLKADVLAYETRLANGQPHWRALMPFLGKALQAIIVPAAASVAVSGLIVLPMLASGLLLGGMTPIEAVGLTVVITVACIALSVISLLFILVLADCRTFDKRGRFLAVVLLLTLLSCKNTSSSPQTEPIGQQPEQAGFYDTKMAADKEIRDKQAAAKTIIRYELPAPLKDRPEQILRRMGYTVSYNRDTRNANWVAWHLTKAHTYGSNQRSQEKFTEDNDVPAPRAVDQDYYSSRYDRGHLCPAGDNKWDAKAMSESFLFTNVCPQNHGLNKYEWNDLEILCRDWARQYGAVDIVCGPIYDTTPPKTIGRNKVWVPDRLFKVVLCRSGQPKAIGFIYRNEGVKQSMEQAVYTVDEVESLTGIDFYPSLDDKLENRIEAEARLGDW